MPNILNHNFQSEKPNEKWITNITEFKLFWEKLYLSQQRPFNVNILQKERRNLYEKNWLYQNKIKVSLGTLLFIFLLGGTYILSI